MSALRRLREGRSGLTLVELIVALVIAAIIIAAAGAILVSSMNMVRNNVSDQADDQLAEYLVGYLADAMEPATGLECNTALNSLGPNQSPTTVLTVYQGQGYTTQQMFYIGDASGNTATKGMLWGLPANSASGTLPVNLFGASYYNNRQISMQLTITGADATATTMTNPADGNDYTANLVTSATISVTVYDQNGNALVTRSHSFKTLNSKPWQSQLPTGTYPSSGSSFFFVIDTD
jgi:prepilin-type N-terminal cleavage/methylation domain-containing protein